MKNKGLGRGLGAILDIESLSEEAKSVARLEEIAVGDIIPNPNQPRTNFDQEALAELADSIRTLGLIQPITVKKDVAGKYMIISGERRWRASQAAGLEKVPAYIREVDEVELHEMALVENIQRQDLNAMEIAISLGRLIDECGVTQENVAQRVGKKRSTVANYLRLLQMSPEIQAALKEDAISMGHAKAIASAPEEAQSALLRKCVRKGLSVRATEQLAKKATTVKPTAEAEEEFPESYTRLVERLSLLLTEDIKIKRTEGGKGKIVIGFSSDEEVEAMISKLNKL
ncbi:MAG: ParB/RepB/Spo0J family partition protein [Tidjanibacter sp.]|nr:ParB/RepB/Spo0J family partition protein [Tidjanibacter sp.]MBQ6604303.1 ParB/RepB/Spo0J family partition protein [Tidjanibacter sp.]